jgi:hypothetical protein
MAKPWKRKTTALAEPGYPVTGEKSPFVGNVSADEDTLERVQVALWAIPALRGRVQAEICAGIVVLTGLLDNQAERTQASDAVRQLAGVERLENLIRIPDMQLDDPGRLFDVAGGPQQQGDAQSSGTATELESQPMLYVSRYCSLHAYSLSAAVEQALGALGRFQAEQQVEIAGAPFIILRNLHGETVTVDLGWPVSEDDARKAAGEIKAGATPSGTMRKIPLGDGFDRLLDIIAKIRALRDLPRHAPKHFYCEMKEGRRDGRVSGLTLFLNDCGSVSPPDA